MPEEVSPRGSKNQKNRQKKKLQGLDQVRKKMKPSGGVSQPSTGYKVMVTTVGQRGRQACRERMTGYL